MFDLNIQFSDDTKSGSLALGCSSSDQLADDSAVGKLLIAVWTGQAVRLD